MGEKLKGNLYKIVLSMLFILLIYVTYCSIFKIYMPAEKLSPIVILLGILVLILFFIGIKKLINKINERVSNIIAVITCILFFIGLSMFGKAFLSVPLFDLSYIQREVMTMLENGGKIVTEGYFAKYPNQVPLTILLYYVYKFGSILRFENLRLFATIINSLFIAITAFFTYLSVKRLKDHKVALITLIFFVINPIFYLYASYFYTDTLCMPFAAMAIYLFISANKSRNNKISILYLVISGFLMALGFKVRVIVGILLLGMIISLFFNNKFSKKTIANGVILVVGFLIGIAFYVVISKPISVPSNKNIELPPTHWIMMAVGEEKDGRFNREDLNFTNTNKTYQEKVNANITEIKNRISNLKLKGIILLTFKRLAVNWSNGDYAYLPRTRNIEKTNSIYEYVSGNRKIFLLYYLQICKATILLITALSVGKEFIKRNEEKEYSMIYISILGAFLFYLMWEVATRYSLSFTPWMFLLFGIGIEQVEKLLNINEAKINKVTIKLNILKTILSLGILICSVCLLFINYYKYTEKEDMYIDTIIDQYKPKGNSPIISNRVIKQTFTTSKPYNSISFKMKNLNKNSEITHYTFKLLDSEGNILYKKKFTSKKYKNGAFKKFIFKQIKSKGNKEYAIQINSNDATQQNSLQLLTFEFGDYIAYPNGKLTIDNEEIKQSLVFKVQNKKIRTYISKKVYLMISTIVIIIELFAIYPYLKMKKQERE